MTLFEVKNLNCKEKENRKLLFRFVMRILKRETKPTIEELQEYCARLDKRYKVKREKGLLNSEISKYVTAVLVNQEVLFIFHDSEYEGYLKYIAVVYCLSKDGKLQMKKKEK